MDFPKKSVFSRQVDHTFRKIKKTGFRLGSVANYVLGIYSPNFSLVVAFYIDIEIIATDSDLTAGRVSQTHTETHTLKCDTPHLVLETKLFVDMT